MATHDPERVVYAPSGLPRLRFSLKSLFALIALVTVPLDPSWFGVSRDADGTPGLRRRFTDPRRSL